MANMKSLSFKFCLQVVLVAISIPASFCSIHPNDEKLIENTCRRTPNYNLCIKLLKSDPGSATTDITGFSLIMVRIINNNAKQTLVKIKQLLRGSKDPKQKEALNQCSACYSAIISVDVPMAIAGLNRDNPNPKIAENGVADAFVEGNVCEHGFSANSPLTQENKSMCDISAVARAIIRNLL